MSSPLPPIPAQTDEHVCHDPATLSWARSMRRFTVAIVLLALGSLGGGAAWLTSVASQAAELRADVRHLAERQVELRTQIRELCTTDQRIERESSGASREVLIQLGSLRTEVQSIVDRLDRVESVPRRER